MAIEPAFVNLPVIYQNAAYRVKLRLTDRLRPATIGQDGLIDCDCHGLGFNTRVVLLSKSPEAQICGAILNRIYYVGLTGLTQNTLRLSEAENNNGLLDVSASSDQDFYLARPTNITDYVIDSDICRTVSSEKIQIATFTAEIENPVDGEISLTLDPAETIAIPVGEYGYDVSMTPVDGNRFYPVMGNVRVASTRSRA